jgi:hypothetical protein
LAAVKPTPQRPAFFSGKFAKEHSFISSGLNFWNNSALDGGVKPFPGPRRVQQLVSFETANDQCIEFLSDGVYPVMTNSCPD